MQLAVIQHSPLEGPGRYLRQAARERGITLTLIRAWEGKFPDPQTFAGFIFLGGSPDVEAGERYPFMHREKEYLKNHILQTDQPCLGICLGHQLLAEAFGAQVGPNFCPSIGTHESLLTAAGRNHPIFRGFSRGFPTFKWHGQAVIPPLPSYFEILATSKECQVEAFSIAARPYVVGIQFDNHAAHPDDVRRWYKRDKTWLDSVAPFPMTMEELIEKIKQMNTRFFHDFSLLFSNFVELCH